MTAKSDYLETAIVNHVLRNTPYTPAATVYCALFTSTPTESGTYPNYGGTEVSGNNYARVPITFGAPSGGSCSNSSPVTFPEATPSGWTTITHFAVIDQLSGGGNMLYFGALTVPKTVAATDVLEFATGQLTIAEL
jgi:hypothetical protein